MLTLHELITQYKKNMDRQQELDQMLLSDQGRDEWIACLQQRAAELHTMFAENEQLIHQLNTLLAQPLSPETAAELYEEAYSMYWDGYDDCHTLLPMFKTLIAYYEAQNDTDRLFFLYGAAFYEENEIQNRRESGKISVDYNLKILAYRDQYTQLSPAERREQFWSAYYNTIVIGLGNRAIDIDTSYHYLEEALSLWNDPKVQALDGNHSSIPRIVRRIINEWMAAEEYIDESAPETQKNFCRLACEAFEREMNEQKTVSNINSEVYAAYLHAQVLLGNRTFDEIIDEYLEYYLENAESCLNMDEMTDEDRYFIINTPLTLERWLHHSVSEEKRKQVIGLLKRFTQDTWFDKLDKYATPFINEILSQWCFKLLKYLDTQQEKEEWMFQFLVRRQLPTYLHSVMVAHLAVPLCREVQRVRPDLLAHIPGVPPENMLTYVRQCSLLHDVGKTRITDIVNTQTRRLQDREFQAIRLHPPYGAEMIGQDKDLAKYYDVIIGHHRLYDGSGGYPPEFDNTASPYRVIIDLITICDCIDAATDHLGRNYKRAKTIDEVISELIAGKGTRYNSELVEIIEKSAALRDEMNHIVSDGRLDIMYHAYLGSTDL